MHKKDCIAGAKGLSTDTAQDFPTESIFINLTEKAPKLLCMYKNDAFYFFCCA